MSEVYFFADTNLFIECQGLDAVDWSLVASASSSVRVIVTRPIQAEIDALKGRGYDRVGKRARTASSLFREILRASNDLKELHDQNPHVTIEIRQDLRPEPTLADRLDYEIADDTLVGIAAGFAKANSGLDVRVLTHDTGPMASAKMVGQPWTEIPDDWLLPPEKTSVEKDLAETKAELLKLKKAEPQFHISCNYKEAEVEEIKGDILIFDMLSDAEIHDLQSALQDRFPMQKEFARPTATGMALIDTLSIYTAPSQDQIDSYQKREYPEWLNKCAKVLKAIHRQFQLKEVSSKFTFYARNDGVRPGQNALVSVIAKGNFEISPPPSDEADNLPTPPSAPQGMYFGGGSFLDPYRGMRTGLGTPYVPRPKQDDAFYYKRRSPIPSDHFELECKLWRHGTEDENFEGIFDLAREAQSELVGALELVIRADNLAQAAKRLVPVRLAVTKGNTFSKALAAIQSFDGKSGAE